MIEEMTTAALLKRVAAKSRPIVVESEEAVKGPAVDTEAGVWTLPGFGAGAKVETSFGHVPVEALRKRDPIRTSDGRFLRVTAVDTIQLDRRYLLTHPDAQPVLVPKDAFGAGTPDRDLLLSGAQTIILPHGFGEKTGKSATDLIGHRGIARKMSGYFTYHVFHCGEPCTAHVDGLWTPIDQDF